MNTKPERWGGPPSFITTRLGDPLPRPLPDGRVIPDEKMVEGLTDLEAMSWLDGMEQYIKENP